ncbi:MAG TPA: transglutaminase domain-containing protein, partial [Ferruginibacter sp.]|nr:transglutaminase domain-containing protein [Ferruginibacter sp.]
YSSEVTKVLLGHDFLGHDVTPEELPDIDLFALTPEMKAFAERVVKRSDSLYDQVKALHYALLRPIAEGGRGIAYNAYSTEIPANTFNARRANCLSFTLLYVALARHVGIDAQVNEVHIPPTWDYRSKNSMVFLRHVNVKVSLRRESQRLLIADNVIIDLEMELYRPNYAQNIISNELIAAQYYSNRAMEFVNENNFKDGFLYLRKALQENDQQSYIWNNLASLYKRKDFLHEAEVIYLHGLKINPYDLTIMNNLAWLYSEMGNEKQTAIYTKLAQRYRQSNPYYQYTLALTAFNGDDYPNALVFIKRALEREQKDARFYQLAANIYTKMGSTSNAAEMTRKYQLLSKTQPIQLSN